MVQGEVEDMVIHLEESMELTSMESGIRLIRAVLAYKTLNKWGIRNVLRSSWREFGDFQIKWVRDNTFIITVKEEEVVGRILEQVPWAVMKQHFVVKRWPPKLAFEEV
ncbi:hypothetical protein TB2_029499 [Malus domestica]